MSRRPVRTSCPCGLPAPYPACCGRFHRGASAPSAELLMRSRFTAFALGDAGYLLRTWDPATAPVTLELDDATVWKRLAVLSATEDAVVFEAFYVHGGVPGTLRERSAFRRLDGTWVYVGPVE